MKTIGITTTIYGNNWGELLQAYALRKAIHSYISGYQAEFIKFKTKSYHPYQKPGFEAYVADNQRKSVLFDDFRRDELGVSGASFSEFTPDNVPLYDNYVFGSDGIWNTTVWSIPEFFGSFVPEGRKKISYAPSVGSPPEKIKNVDCFEKYIKTFDFVSVREKVHCDFLKKYTDKEIHFVCDPTLLLTADNYCDLIKDVDPPKPDRQYIFYYQPHAADGAIISLVDKLARMYNMDVVHTFADIPACVFPGASFSAKFYGPKEFLSYIKDAAVVITRSYHGAIFATLFKRPLYAFVDKKSGTRFESLFTTLGMDDRLIYEYLKPEDADLVYDYHSANQKLEHFRESSLDYLRAALEA